MIANTFLFLYFSLFNVKNIYIFLKFSFLSYFFFSHNVNMALISAIFQKPWDISLKIQRLHKEVPRLAFLATRFPMGVTFWNFPWKSSNNKNVWRGKCLPLLLLLLFNGKIPITSFPHRVLFSFFFFSLDCPTRFFGASICVDIFEWSLRKISTVMAAQVPIFIFSFLLFSENLGGKFIRCEYRTILLVFQLENLKTLVGCSNWIIHLRWGNLTLLQNIGRDGQKKST